MQHLDEPVYAANEERGEEEVGEKQKTVSHNSRLQRPQVAITLLCKNMIGRRKKGKQKVRLKAKCEHRILGLLFLPLKLSLNQMTF